MSSVAAIDELADEPGIGEHARSRSGRVIPGREVLAVASSRSASAVDWYTAETGGHPPFPPEAGTADSRGRAAEQPHRTT